MSLKVGLVGLPNAGKSTLFQALTKQQALIADYPFATIDPNIGYRVISNPDLRALADLYPEAKVSPATIEIIDIAGLIAGAHRGEGLGNKFLAHVRQTDLIAYVGGLFSNQAEPAADLDIILTEILLADYQVLEKQAQKLAKVAKNEVQAAGRLAAIKTALELIDAGNYLYDSSVASSLRSSLKDLDLLSLKPLLLVFNLADQALNDQGLQERLARLMPQCPRLYLSAQLEDEVGQLPVADQTSFLEAYGLKASGLEAFAPLVLKRLKRQTFLTAGPKEVKAWLIPASCPAPVAAGAVHSDMQRGFIAAEVINVADLLQHRSWTKAKAAGVCRLEGRQYAMQPGDVVNFKFNV